MHHLYKPKIRNMNIRHVMFEGEPVFLLWDSFTWVKIPQFLEPLLLLCDGSHSLPEIRTALEVQYDLSLTHDMLENFLTQFDQALLLESETFERVRQATIAKYEAALAAYRGAPFRQPLSAGYSYPAEPAALRQILQGYLDQVKEPVTVAPTSRAMISPHIDYGRGGAVYAQVWASMAQAVRQAELIIILGTDHRGSIPGSLTLTCQNYASPLGIMPTDRALVEQLAQALGPQTVFAGELLHRDEWSIELALIWLQFMRNGNPCPVLPVLTGSFQHFMTERARIEEETQYQVFVELLQAEMARRRTVIVASGDLAHLGPEFDTPPLDQAAQARMEQDDQVLLKTLSQGQAKAFFEFMKAGQYERNVCGFPPFYFTLSLLGPTRGQAIGYARCPAERNGREFKPNGSSFVSVGGMVWE